MVPSTSEFAYTLPDGTKRKVLRGEGVNVRVLQENSDGTWEGISARFITAEDCEHAYLAGRTEKGPSKREAALEKQLADGIIRGVAIPSSLLAYPAFLPELRRWLQSRSKKGGFPQSDYFVKLFARLSNWGPARATAALEFSADNEYQGLFEPNGSSAKKNSAPQRHGHTDANAAKLREKMGR